MCHGTKEGHLRQEGKGPGRGSKLAENQEGAGQWDEIMEGLLDAFM